MSSISGKRRRGVSWMTTPRRWAAAGLSAAALAGTGLAVAPAHAGPADNEGAAAGRLPYIIVAKDAKTADQAASKGGDKHSDALSLINGAVADMTAADAAKAADDAGVLAVVPDQVVTLQDVTTTSSTASGTTSSPVNVFRQISGADALGSQGTDGSGVGVAVIDTGISNLPDFAGHLVGGVDLSGEGNPFADGYGHGTFVAGLIAGNGASSGGQYVGEAPGANLIAVKVAGATGVTDMATVIKGLSWVVNNAARYNIKVVNLSLGVVPTGPTATEPLDIAVENAWMAGITTVVSAGNAGPFNGTVLSPGDDPLALTVGALDDGHSTSPSAWSVPAWSSVGPTAYDGWFKPDVIASGRSVVSVRDPGSYIDTNFPTARVGTGNFVGSGTSFSAAITSGMAALVAQAYPWAQPDDLKARLVGTTMPGPVGSPFVDGHGVANAANAIAAHSIGFNQQKAQRAEVTNPVQPVSLAQSWKVSNWNGSAWNGSAWNGSAWNGATWTGSAWNGSAWNGSAWNGSAWNGSAWNGATWTGATWTGATWTGSAWNGAAWTGSAWNGSAWNGSAWNGSAWNGSAWNGAAWTGAAWTGSAWNGAAWTGSAWNGSSWS
ncbi:MAG TPA: S8 family serine peptidase [Acidimicrobiales bacterium]|nr:S8 family serine peptidase [Acidimicrobiales bacterium]